MYLSRLDLEFRKKGAKGLFSKVTGLENVWEEICQTLHGYYLCYELCFMLNLVIFTKAYFTIITTI